MKRISVDVDGVLYPFAEEFTKHLTDYEGWTQTGPITRWAMWNFFVDQDGEAMTKNVFHKLLKTAVHARIFNRPVPPADGAVDVLRAARKNGWHVHILTSKGFSDKQQRMLASQQVVDWLHWFEVPYDSLTVSSGPKWPFSSESDVIVDDKPHIEEWANMDAHNLLFDRPWNQEVERGLEPAQRVFSWHEIGELL